MTNLISQQNAEQILNQYMPILNNIFTTSLEDFTTILNAYNLPLTKRSKAVLFHNLIMNRAKENFTENEDLKIIEKYETLSIVFEDKISIRFKKLNLNFMPSNIRTKRNDKVITQQLSFDFPNFTQFITSLDMGYIINSTYSEYDNKIAVCRLNKEIIWKFEISSVAQSDESNVTLFNEPENIRVKIKSQKENDGKEAEL
jgi:hypothetical protein